MLGSDLIANWQYQDSSSPCQWISLPDTKQDILNWWFLDSLALHWWVCTMLHFAVDFPSSSFLFFPDVLFLEEVPPSVNWFAFFLSPSIQNLRQDDRNNRTKTLIVSVGTSSSAKMWEIKQNQVTLMLLNERINCLSRWFVMSPLSKGEKWNKETLVNAR